MTFHRDQNITHQGRAAHVLAVDSDPTCDVWIAYDETDEDAIVNPNELTAR